MLILVHFSISSIWLKFFCELGRASPGCRVGHEHGSVVLRSFIRFFILQNLIHSLHTPSPCSWPQSRLRLERGKPRSVASLLPSSSLRSSTGASLRMAFGQTGLRPAGFVLFLDRSYAPRTSSRWSELSLRSTTLRVGSAPSSPPLILLFVTGLRPCPSLAPSPAFSLNIRNSSSLRSSLLLMFILTAGSGAQDGLRAKPAWPFGPVLSFKFPKSIIWLVFSQTIIDFQK